MNIPIPILQAQWKARQWLQLVRERLAPHKRMLSIVAAVPVTPLAVLLAPHYNVRPAALVLEPAPVRVLVVHSYAATAESAAAPAAEILRPRPHLDINGVMNSCGSEIGVICHEVQEEPWAAVRCLRRHADYLRPVCLKSLRPPQEVASND